MVEYEIKGKEREIIKCWLEVDEDGYLALHAQKGNVSDIILWLTPDGELLLSNNISEKLGFRMDDDGSISITE